MAIFAAEVITNAYYLSGTVAEDFETVGKDDMTRGFKLLNYILGDKNLVLSAIPFYSKYSVSPDPGDSFIFVPNLLLDESLTFSIGDTRYSTQRMNRDQFFSTDRCNFSSLIVAWHPERALNGTNIYFYPFPQSNYPIEVWGKFALSQLTSKDQDLTQSYEIAYIDYFTYKLASRICHREQLSVPPSVEEEIKKFELQMIGANPIDFTVQVYSTLDTFRHGINFAQLNLG